MNIKYSFFVFLCTLLSFKGIAQSSGTVDVGVLPSSPEASNLGKFIDCPVSPFTGTHNLVIPLHEIKAGNFSMPISLAYHSSGVKVQEIASRVGMGWVLNGGGSIVCAVNGIPDLGFNGVSDPS